MPRFVGFDRFVGFVRFENLEIRDAALGNAWRRVFLSRTGIRRNLEKPLDTSRNPNWC